MAPAARQWSFVIGKKSMRRLFIILAKLIGILQLYWAIVALAQIGTVIDLLMRHHDAIESDWHFATLMGTVSYLVLSLGAAWICLKKTDWLANQLGLSDVCASGDVVVKEGDLLRTGVKLIGVYILAYAIPAFVQTMFGYGIFSGGAIGAEFWTMIIPSALRLFLGAFLAIGSEHTIAFISTAEQADPRRIILICLGFFVLVLLLGLAVSSHRSEDYNTYQTGTVISKTTVSVMGQLRGADRKFWRKGEQSAFSPELLHSRRKAAGSPPSVTEALPVSGCVDFFKSAITNTAYGVDWSKPRWYGERKTNEQATTNWQNLKIKMN
jgi:hypothetical protein